MKPMLLLLLAMVPLRGLAQEVAFRSHDGVAYAQVPAGANDGAGLMLRSQRPAAYHVGRAGRLVTGEETLHVRQDCTATSSLLGEGRWSRTADGLNAVFVGPTVVAIQGQVLPDAPEACRE